MTKIVNVPRQQQIERALREPNMTYSESQFHSNLLYLAKL